MRRAYCHFVAVFRTNGILRIAESLSWHYYSTYASVDISSQQIYKELNGNTRRAYTPIPVAAFRTKANNFRIYFSFQLNVFFFCFFSFCVFSFVILFCMNWMNMHGDECVLFLANGIIDGKVCACAIVIWSASVLPTRHGDCEPIHFASLTIRRFQTSEYNNNRFRCKYEFLTMNGQHLWSVGFV